MTSRFAVIVLAMLAWVFVPRPAYGQQLLQDFEQGLLYDQCFAGENVSLSTNQPMEGAQQLTTGPLNANKSAFYVTPFLMMQAGGFVRFKHRNDSPSDGNGTLFVDLLDPTGSTAATIYAFTHGPNSQPIVAQPQVPAAGLYQVRFRFEGDRGNERIGLDELNIDGVVSVTTPPCRPIIDGQPPTAVADSASSLAAQPVVLSLLDNDVAGTSPIDPATVDLVPGGTAVIERERDIRNESGVVIARAVVDALGNVSVTPTPEASGTIVFAYSVRDTAGRISNIAQVTVTVLEASTDLQVTLTGPTAAEAGSDANYVATVENMGPAASAEATLTFQVAGQLTVVAVSCPGRAATCSNPVVSGTTATIQITGLGPGHRLNVLLLATALTPGVATVTATIVPGSPAIDPVPGNNSQTISTTVGPVPGADVAIALTGPTEAFPGRTITYTIAVSNNGPDAANGVVVQSPGPPGAVFVGNAGACATPFPCALGTVPVGTPLVIASTYSLPLPPGFIAPQAPLVNSATVSATGPADPNPANNSATISSEVVVSVDVGLSIAAPISAVPAGQIGTVVVVAANRGPMPARSVPVVITWPAELEIVSATVTSGQVNPTTRTWTIPEINPSDQHELTVTFRPLEAGSFGVTATAQVPPTDVQVSNDVAAASIQASASADLAVQLSASTLTPVVGQQIQILLQAGNLGPTGATGVSVQQVLPPGLQFVSAVPGAGTTFEPTTGTWTIGPMAGGLSDIKTLTTIAIVQATGPLVISATARGTEFDPDSTNNTTALALNAAGSADLQVAMSADNPSPAAGDVVDVVGTLTNRGPTTAENVVVAFDLTPPNSIVIESVTASQGTISGSSLIVGALAPGAIVTVTARLRVIAVDPITLGATATSSTFDPQPANNRAVILMNAGHPLGAVTEDFENRTGSFVCWATPGMSPGGLTPTGGDFGQTALNPPLQLLVHMVTGPLNDPADTNAIESPWIRFSGQGTIAYLTKVNNVTSGPVQTVSLIDVTTGAETVIYNRVYGAADGGVSIRDSLPITVTGVFKIRWSFAGSAGISRAAIDDIVIDGELATAGGGDATLPYDCRPNLSNPPEARDDFASTGPGAPVLIPILANDLAPGSTLNPATVTLDPVFSPGQVTAIDVFQADGTTLGHATVDAGGQVRFTPVPGVTGSGVIPYAVKNVRGALSNIAYVSVVVGSAATDVATEILGPASANPGQAVPYTLLLRNNGPGVVGGLNVSGAATNGLRIVSVACTVPGGFSCGLGTVAGDGASFTLDLVGLSRQGPTMLTISTVAPAAGSVALTATAALLAPVTDTNPANNSATANTNIVSAPPVSLANLSIRKTGPHWITAGDVAVYTLTVINGGPDTASSVTVEDPPPPGFTQLSVQGDCTALPCNLGNLQPGALRQVTVRYATDGAARSPGGSPVVNRASVSSQTADPNAGDNVSEMTTLVHLRYDLGVTISAATPVVLVGQPAVIKVEVRNQGTLEAAGVVVNVPIAPGVTFVSASPEGVSFDAATGDWTIGNLPAETVAQLSLTVTVDPGPHTLTATITGGLAGDTNSANDQSAAEVVSLPAADTALSATVSNDAPVEGEVITIVLTARNLGPSDATGIVIAGVVPAGLTLQSATASSGSVDAASQTWNLPLLSAGTAAELQLVARVDTTGPLDLSALITDQNEIDIHNANNSTGVLINAGPSADIQVDVTSPGDFVTIGEPVPVRITVVNAGPSDADSAVVQAQLPAGISISSLTPSVGLIDGGRWVIGTLAPGAQATLDLDAVLTAYGEVVVSVRASSSDYDPDPTNNVATVAINSVGADVRLTMFPGTLSPFISANATMYVRVTNEGPGTAQGVTVPIAMAPALARLTQLVSQGSFDPNTSTWFVGTIPPHTSAQMALFVRVSDAGQLQVTGQAVVGGGADLKPDNNQAFGVFDVFDPTRTVADMQLTMTGPPSVVPGALVSFAADAVNNGSTYAVDVTTTVDVPPWASFVSATPTFGGACTTPAPGSSSGTVQCVWPGQSVVGQGRLRRVEVVLSAAAGIAEGTALTVNGSVTSLTLDPFPANNLAVANTVANSGGPSADIQLAKFMLADGAVETTVLQGQTAIYRVVVSNAGAEAASGIEILETVLPELPILRGRWSQGTVDQSRRRWSVGSLAPGASATLDIEVRAAAAGRFTLPATRMASAPFDSNASNDRASILIDVPPAGAGGRYVATGNVDGLGSADVLVGTGIFEPTQIRIFAGDGSPIAAFYPYDPRFQGGVRVASCDIDADGRDEIITAAGPGGGPHVRVVKLFPGDRITEFLSFYAASPDYNGGLYVACGDVTGDGTPEVIVGSGLHTAPEFAVWEVGAFSFTEIARMRFNLGMPSEVRVATCDVNGDGRNEVLAASGAGPAAVVGVIDPLTRQVLRVIRPLNGFTGGVFVACGDMTPSFSGPEIVVSSDAGGPPIVEFYSADGARLTGVFSEPASFVGGVRVAVGDVDPTPMSELIAVAGFGGLPRVRLASGANNVLVELRTFVSPNVP